MIKSNGMTTQHQGYTIEAVANQSEGMWAADVWIWPTLISFAHMLVDKGAVQGCDSQQEAEEAGRIWGELRIDNWIEKKAR